MSTFYTQYVRGLVGSGIDDGAVEAGRFESLCDFVSGVLERHSALNETLRSSILTEPPVRKSVHGPYRAYYDAELRDLVARKAARLIDRFEYTF